MNCRLNMFTLMIVGALATLASAAELTHTNDSLDVVKARVAEQKAVIVDVRSEDEWKDGRVKQALHLPVSDLPKVDEVKLKEKLPKDKIVYTYCAAGVRSLKAGKILQKYGYDVRPLEPGFEELAKAGFEIAK